MSLDLEIYTKDLSIDLILKLQNRFLDFNMDVEFHPNFSFDKHSGFLPFRLKMLIGKLKHYDEFGSDVLSGFELYIDDFDYQKELKESLSFIAPLEKETLFSKLFRFTRKQLQKDVFISDKERDQLLKNCNKRALITWQSYNKSELRISLFFAAILAEFTNGVVFDPQNARYLTGSEAIKTFALEVEDYEQSFSSEQFHLEKFEGWS